MSRSRDGTWLTTRSPMRSCAARDLLETRHHPQRGRLPAARRADEHHELAVVDREAQGVDGRRPVRIRLRHSVERHSGHACPPVAPTRVSYQILGLYWTGVAQTGRRRVRRVDALELPVARYRLAGEEPPADVEAGHDERPRRARRRSSSAGGSALSPAPCAPIVPGRTCPRTVRRRDQVDADRVAGGVVALPDRGLVDDGHRDHDRGRRRGRRTRAGSGSRRSRSRPGRAAAQPQQPDRRDVPRRRVVIGREQAVAAALPLVLERLLERERRGHQRGEEERDAR